MTRLALVLLLWGLGADALELVRVPHSLAAEWKAAGVDFAPDHFSHPLYQVGYLSERDFRAHGARALRLDERRWAAGGYDPVTFNEKRWIHGQNYAGYHDYKALTSELSRIAGLHPNFVRLQSAGKSVQGRELWYVVLSDNAQADEPEPNFIYHANMHGDEVVGRELMLMLIEYLLDNYGKDSRITQLIDHAQLFIMPSMNPDGFELRTRANARGKDLNRNFPDRFDSPSDTPAKREIEVQHMMALAAKYHFVYGLNWHGGEICFNLPWGNISNANPANKYGDDSFFAPIGREYTALNRPMYANHHGNFDHGLTYGYEWYPVSGGINDWFNFFRRSVHSVVELSVVKWPNASELPSYWNDNREAMITYLWRGLRGVHLEIRDSSGALVKDPLVTVASSEKRPLRFDDGYVHRLTGDGTQDVTITAPGFKTKSVRAPATYFDGQYVTVTLEP
jgi:hypothetical protein